VGRMSPDGEGSRPGSEVTLIALYDAVPASEELDLREDWQRDQAEKVKDLLSVFEDTSGAEGDEDDEPVEPLTDRQVFGMVEHLLGGELIDEDQEGDDRPGR